MVIMPSVWSAFAGASIAIESAAIASGFMSFNIVVSFSVWLHVNAAECPPRRTGIDDALSKQQQDAL
jgi:hypothetical protein